MLTFTDKSPWILHALQELAAKLNPIGGPKLRLTSPRISYPIPRARKSDACAHRRMKAKQRMRASR